ncbi:MAG TPA: hypothetical protein V6C90_11185 [Coleofasciculaceae cyanobacterium]
MRYANVSNWRYSGHSQSSNYGKKANQKLHSWSFGTFRFLLTEKAQLLGLKVVWQDERHISPIYSECANRHMLYQQSKI